MATGALTSLIHAVAQASDHDLFWAAFVAADLAIWILRERHWRRRVRDAREQGARDARIAEATRLLNSPLFRIRL